MRTIDAFRASLGLYFCIYYLQFYDRISFLYSQNGMVNRDLLGAFKFSSLLFLFPSPPLVYLHYGLVLGFSLFYSLGLLKRVWAIFFFFLCVSLNNANPYILHEAEQLAMLLLFISVLFLPTKKQDPVDSSVVSVLICFLCIYYFLAGVKKLPDPAWLSGDAVGLILQWDGARESYIHWKNFAVPGLSKILTFSALFIEMGFCIWVYFGFRKFAFLSSLALQLGIFLTMDVGLINLITVIFTLLVLPPDIFNKSSHWKNVKV